MRCLPFNFLSLKRWDIARIDAPIRTSKDRQAGETSFECNFQPDPNGFSGKEEVGRYICTICPDDREMPGFEGVVAKWDRNKHGERAKKLFFLKKPFNFKKTFLTSQPYTYTKQVTIDIRTRNDIALWEHFVLIHVHLNPLGHLCIHWILFNYHKWYKWRHEQNIWYILKCFWFV